MGLPLNPVERANVVAVRRRCTHYLAASDALQTQTPHQPSNSATGNLHLVAPKLFPDLHDAIALHVVLPYTPYLITQQLVLLRTSASPFGLSVTCGMQVVTGRSDLRHAADRLDPVTVTVLVNEGVQCLLRRSSSAWAK